MRAENLDLLDINVRKKIIQETLTQENKDRKKESLRRFEIYKNRQELYILNKLREEFTEKTVRDMRKVTSINLTRRVIDEMASLYKNAPERTWIDTSKTEDEALSLHYAASEVDVQLKLANRYFKLFDQTALYIIPMDGKLWVKPLAPHWYDVIPDANNPEKAFAYVLNILDKHEFLQDVKDIDDNKFGTGDNLRQNQSPDGINQSIAEGDDYRASLAKYIVWTDDLHFKMNARGEILSTDDEGELVVENPIGRLPFIDVHSEKDFEFFCRYGSSVTDFTVDFGVQLSDHSNILRLQGYSQAIITSEKQPVNMTVGVNHAIWLEQDASRPDVQPKFEFASPSPDLSSSLETLEVQLKLFLSSMGLDPTTVSGKADGQKFTSGLDRLLSMVSKFEASRDDAEMFTKVEQDLKQIMVLWNNALQDADDPLIALDPKLKNGNINEDCLVEVSFEEPSIIQTKTEKEDSIIKRKAAGLITELEAIMIDRDLEDEKEAQKILDEIKKDKEIRLDLVSVGGLNGGTEVQEEQSQPDDQP
jgi:hypothetical protein